MSLSVLREYSQESRRLRPWSYAILGISCGWYNPLWLNNWTLHLQSSVGGNSMSHMKNPKSLMICWDLTPKEIADFITVRFVHRQIFPASLSNTKTNTLLFAMLSCASRSTKSNTSRTAWAYCLAHLTYSATLSMHFRWWGTPNRFRFSRSYTVDFVSRHADTWAFLFFFLFIFFAFLYDGCGCIIFFFSL